MMMFKRSHARPTWRGILATVAGVAIVLSATTSPANAAEPVDEIAQILESHGLLVLDAEATQADTGGLSRVSPDEGLAVAGDEDTLRMVPVTDSTGVRIGDVDAIVYRESDYAYALTGGRVAADAGYVVVTSDSAPDEYRFALTVNGAPAQLEPSGDGVIVKDSRGKQVNFIQAPWARDGSGAPVATNYRVEGSILVQTVDHRGAQYPVVADPRLACDGLWCTLELNRRETGEMADNALNPGILCGLLGPGGPACIVLVVGGWAMANIARSTGQCIGVRVWQKTMWTQMHLAYIPCYA